jgi:hypothetical protein
MTEVALSDTDQAALFDGDNFAPGYSLPGYSKIDKAWLVGVPHVITRVTFWVPQMGNGHCSVEGYVGTQNMLNRASQRGRIEEMNSDGTAKVDAEEPIVYADGSTGIRRQLVELLCTYGLVTIKSKLPAEGAMGESRYDLPWSEWESFAGSRKQGTEDVPCIEESHTGAPLRIHVKNGLGASTGGANRPAGAEPTYYLR